MNQSLAGQFFLGNRGNGLNGEEGLKGEEGAASKYMLVLIPQVHWTLNDCMSLAVCTSQ